MLFLIGNTGVSADCVSVSDGVSDDVSDDGVSDGVSDGVVREMVFAHLLQVNEIAWNRENDQFFLTNGNGCVVILR